MRSKVLSVSLFSLLLLSSCGGTDLNSTASIGGSSSEDEIMKPSNGENLSEDNIVIIDGKRYEKRQEIYRNPVYYEEFPDPHMIYDQKTNTYWGFATGQRMISSKNLVDWTPHGFVLNRTPSWGTPNAAVWAPDIQYINGQYVYYYSLSTWGDENPGIGVASAPRPNGPWVDHGELFRSIPIGVNNSIDAMVFVDPISDRVYLVWGSMRGNFMIELTKDGLALKDGTQEEAAKNKVWVAGLSTDIGWTIGTYEGAYIIYRHGYYYLFLSTGSCCAGLDSTYKVIVGRSKNVTGPYVDALGRDLRAEDVGSPVLSGDDKGKFVGPGHNSILVDADGNDWIFYHSYTSERP